MRYSSCLLYTSFPNHQGLFDVLAIIEACDQPFSVVAKKEVKDVPFLKQVFRIMKAKIMDREDVRQSLQVILAVTEEVKNGRNYLIFPEGTRSKQGNQVGDFKGGSFKCAVKARAPIVPVALLNAFEPFDRNSIAPVSYTHLRTEILCKINCYGRRTAWYSGCPFCCSVF